MSQFREQSAPELSLDVPSQEVLTPPHVGVRGGGVALRPPPGVLLRLLLDLGHQRVASVLCTFCNSDSGQHSGQTKQLH